MQIPWKRIHKQIRTEYGVDADTKAEDGGWQRGGEPVSLTLGCTFAPARLEEKA
jgi:hypothetical protein